jgi:hypothetical protein
MLKDQRMLIPIPIAYVPPLPQEIIVVLTWPNFKSIKNG